MRDQTDLLCNVYVALSSIGVQKDEKDVSGFLCSEVHPLAAVHFALT